MDWASEEVKTIDLGDKRLDKRAKIILKNLTGRQLCR